MGELYLMANIELMKYYPNKYYLQMVSHLYVFFSNKQYSLPYFY